MLRTLTLGLGLFAICAMAVAQTETISVDGGKITGIIEDGVHVYKGIPFAAPPTGKFRWKAPQPVIPWDSVKQCDTFGAGCPQPAYPKASLNARYMGPLSEDCIYLNICTPAEVPS